MEPEKCGQVEWFPLDNIPEKFVPYGCKAIKYYLKEISFSHFLPRQSLR